MEGIIISPKFHLVYQSFIGELTISKVRIEKQDFISWGNPHTEFTLIYPNTENIGIRVTQPLERMAEYISKKNIKDCRLNKVIIIDNGLRRKIRFEYTLNFRYHESSGEYELVTLPNEELEARMDEFEF